MSHLIRHECCTTLCLEGSWFNEWFQKSNKKGFTVAMLKARVALTVTDPTWVWLWLVSFPPFHALNDEIYSCIIFILKCERSLLVPSGWSLLSVYHSILLHWLSPVLLACARRWSGWPRLGSTWTSSKPRREMDIQTLGRLNIHFLVKVSPLRMVLIAFIIDINRYMLNYLLSYVFDYWVIIFLSWLNFIISPTFSSNGIYLVMVSPLRVVLLAVIIGVVLPVKI